MDENLEFWGHWSETVRLHCIRCDQDLLDDMEFAGCITLAAANAAAAEHDCVRDHD